MLSYLHPPHHWGTKDPDVVVKDRGVQSGEGGGDAVAGGCHGVSGYFSDLEFLCRCRRVECNAPGRVSLDLDARLNELRRRVGRPVKITSALRCQFWNSHEGGAVNSGHLDGTEADVAVATGAERWELMTAVLASEVPLFTRLGIGSSFLHVGVVSRLPQRVVWTYSSGTA